MTTMRSRSDWTCSATIFEVKRGPSGLGKRIG